MATPVRIVMSTSRVPRPGTVIHVTQKTGTQSVTVPAAKKMGTGEAKSALNVIKSTPAARVKVRAQHAVWNRSQREMSPANNVAVVGPAVPQRQDGRTCRIVGLRAVIWTVSFSDERAWLQLKMSWRHVLIRESYAITVPLVSEEIDAVCVRMVAREKTAISVKQITSQKRARRSKYARYTAILPPHAMGMAIVSKTGSAFVKKAGQVMAAACPWRSKL